MLNQSANNREDLAKLLNISDEQMSYITNAPTGCGLIKYGGSIVPFVNKMPKGLLYDLNTTKPGDRKWQYDNFDAGISLCLTHKLDNMIISA